MEEQRLEAVLTTEPPSRLEVGRGNVLFLEGHCSHPAARVSALKVVVDDLEHPVIAHGISRPDAPQLTDRWWALVPFAPIDRPRAAAIGLRAKLRRGGTATAALTTLRLEPGPEAPPPAPSPSRPDEAPLIAICMATHRPPRALFERQVASIKDQTHANWVCLISDDDSGPQALAEMRRAVGDDPRFRISAHEDRLGFYGNFERALRLVPPAASYVAFADQDDRWYPDKLEVLRSTLEEEGANLAYSDMRIVTEQGEVVSETFWRYRKNNHENLASVLIANTITGAASLFRRDLLDHALPLPPRHGKSFHDHWIATVALALGTVSYVERPLYDYVQHGAASQGFIKANRRGVERAEAGRLARLRRVGAAPRDRELESAQLTFRARWQAVYFKPYMRTQISARVLDMRCASLMARRRRRAVRRVIGLETSPVAFAWLAARSLRPALGASATFGRERKLLGAILWRRLVKTRGRLRRGAGRRRLRSAASPPDLPFDDAALESRLVWILGSPRTGSTWLLGLLIHPLRLDPQRPAGCFLPGAGPPMTPAIVPINEPYVPRHLTPLQAPPDLAGRPDQPDTSEFTLNRRRASHPSYLFSDHYAPVWRPALRSLILLRFHAQVERAVSETPVAADPVVAIKEPNGSYGAELLMSLFPRSRMIFLQRDGRDVIDSLLDRWLSDRPAGARAVGDAEGSRLKFVRERSRHWVNAMRATQAAYEAHPPELRAIVRYEELLADPQGALRRLFDWLGLERTDADLRAAVAANAFEAVAQELKGPGRARRSATPGLWRENMGEAEQAAMEEIMGEQLRALGYETAATVMS